MPDKIVPLWKVVGEVSETAFLDPPNTQYWVVRNSLRWGYLVWRYREPPEKVLRVGSSCSRAAIQAARSRGGDANRSGRSDTPRVPALRPGMTGRGHAVRVTKQGRVTF